MMSGDDPHSAGRAALDRVASVRGLTAADESPTLARLIVDHAPAGIALYGPDGQCVAANEALALMTGADVPRLRAQNFRRIESWKRHGLLERAEACLASGQSTRIETWIDSSFSTRICLDCRFVPVEAAAGRSLLLLVDDRTEDRHREDALLAHQRRLLELHGLAGELAAHDDLEALMRTAADRARSLTGADFAVIVRIDRETGRPGRAYPSNYPTDAIPPGTEVEGRGILGRIAQGATIHTAQVDAEPGFVGWPEWHPQVGPMIGVPVREGDRVDAVLLVGRKPDARPFDGEDRVVVETVARLCAVAMRVSTQFAALQTLNAQLAELASTDPLLGIGNRRAFTEAVRFQHATALRYGVPYGLLLGDLDHFKPYNDRYGHPAGDRALVAVGDVLRGAIRAVDGVFRWGGEEIVLLLPHQRRDGTAVAGERLRRLVEAAAIERGGVDAGALTISFGGATFEPDQPAVRGLGWEDVLGAADKALYAAKEAGRNRVEMTPVVRASTS